MKINIIKKDVYEIDTDFLKKQSHEPLNWVSPGKSPFPFYSYISTLISNKIILDIGTRTGNSALAFSYNETNLVKTYDITDWISWQTGPKINRPNIEWILKDFREDSSINYDEVGIILIDIDPHIGFVEKEMIEFLEQKKWKGLLLFDDIYWPSNFAGIEGSSILQELFKSFDKYEKFDLSDLGCLGAGLGMINFGNAYEVIIN
jgi:hypothetical protein